MVLGSGQFVDLMFQVISERTVSRRQDGYLGQDSEEVSFFTSSKYGMCNTVFPHRL